MTVPAGKFIGCLRVRQSGPLSTGVGTKWYASGLGLVRDKAKGQHLLE